VRGLQHSFDLSRRQIPNHHFRWISSVDGIPARRDQRSSIWRYRQPGYGLALAWASGLRTMVTDFSGPKG
jgi:hypothetical protein